MSYNQLTAEEKQIIEHKGTEPPGTGEYDQFFENGTFICRRCNSPLFSSKDKFEAHCGWPSFDQEINDSLKKLPDTDGERTEIECGHCGAHLGHVFYNEHFTDKNTRHCVNSLAIRFVKEGDPFPAILDA